MSIFNTLTAEFLIILFFSVTYFYSVFEKLQDWSGTISYYTNHFKAAFFIKYISKILISIVIFESIIFILLGISLVTITLNSDTILGKIGLEISALVLILFLIGQRVAKDYPGAMNITVYFILNVIGIYLLT
jgi:hypothetical protein